MRLYKYLNLVSLAIMGVSALASFGGCTEREKAEGGNKKDVHAELDSVVPFHLNVAEESMRNAGQYYWPESDSIVKVDPNKIYTCAEVSKMPTYKFGDDSLFRFIKSQIRYPRKAKENGIRCRVTVRFKVDKNGRLSNFSVARGKSPELDKEALRVVKLIPRLEPAMMGRHRVAVWYNIPIYFELPPDSAKTKQ